LIKDSFGQPVPVGVPSSWRDNVAVNSFLKKEHVTSLGFGTGVAAMPAVGVVPGQKCQSISAQNSLKAGVLNNLPWLVPGHGFH
jgi:hypothetical protein